MKRSISYYLLSILLIGLFFETSCKKYPDGPILSLETKAFRLTGWNFKRWDVDYFSINGYDSTSYLKNQQYYGKYTFAKKNKDGRSEFSYTSNNLLYGAGGEWKFANNKKDIEISSSANNSSMHFNLGPYAAVHQTWEIQRLTEKDLWLKCTYSGKEYFVKFKY